MLTMHKLLGLALVSLSVSGCVYEPGPTPYASYPPNYYYNQYPQPYYYGGPSVSLYYGGHYGHGYHYGHDRGWRR